MAIEQARKETSARVAEARRLVREQVARAAVRVASSAGRAVLTAVGWVMTQVTAEERLRPSDHDTGGALDGNAALCEYTFD
ncbi:hypothetical protein [Streptosporangium sp. NBC_01469]|uniref:hypothetical protein n=1 Tax=Streptosporangium sp. NBC_01469 TaxID=2903898 RepID=UPI002E2BEEC0|nr:hypothetical protein [Streptosporangium sp. NBC_01469]